MQLIVFDTETSGLSPQGGHRIIELGAVKLADGRVIDEFNQLIDAGVHIDPRAAAVHGISPAMLRGQPRPEQVYPDFRRFIGSAQLVAHNAPFDSRFLRQEFSLLGFDLPNHLQCTLRLSRSRLPELRNHRLDTVFRSLGGVMRETMQRHRALDDARMAAFVWLALQELE